MKNKFFNILLIIAAFFLTCLAIAWGSYFRTGFTLEPNTIANFMIKAPKDVVNEIATERNRLAAAEKANNTPEIKTKDPDVQLQVFERIDDLYSKLVGIRKEYRDEMTGRQAEEAQRQREVEEQQAAEVEREAARAEAERQAEEERLAEAAAGTEEPPPFEATPSPEPAPSPEPSDPEPSASPSPQPSDLSEKPWESLKRFSSLNVIFTEAQQNYIVSCEDNVLLAIFTSAKEVAVATLEQGVPATEGDDLTSKTVQDVQSAFEELALEKDASDIGFEIVTRYLLPNEIVDEEATRQQRDRIASEYAEVRLRQNQTIVDEGQLISEEAYEIIKGLGMLDTGLADKAVSMVGVFTLIGIIFAACGMYLFTFHKPMGQHRKETLLLFALYVIELTAMWSLSSLDEYYVLPLLIFPMLVSILIDMRASILLSLGVTITGFFIVNGSTEYLLFYMAAGIVISLLSKFTTERNKIFLVGFLIAFINFILSCAVSFIIEKNQAFLMRDSILTTAAFTSLNGMLTVIVCMGTLPFWETFFGVVTPVKLLDLTNPTNPLLRRLTIEAPGTYHHSLIVANLAETAAYDIGANPHTARAGGYYHDIGKLKYPQYFAENLAGENPHDHMDPFNSVQLIVSHVAYGLTLGAEYRLPQFIRDIISEHHGTSLIQFFYVKAKEASPDNGVNEKDFRYPYTIPQTRESACVMLADTVEAAVRSMIPHVKSVDEVENKINFLIRNKLNDGQLADSQLSIKDVSIIEKSFFRVLKGMYHERIPYPKLEEPEEV